MARCSKCVCQVADTDTVTWTGTGSAADPMVVHGDAGGTVNCTLVQDTIGAMAGKGLAWDGVGRQLSIAVSADAGNSVGATATGLEAATPSPFGCSDIHTDCAAAMAGNGVQWNAGTAAWQARVGGAGNGVHLSADSRIWARYSPSTAHGAWQNITLLNGATAAPSNVPQVRTIADGRVQMRGGITCPATATNPVQIGTLPAGTLPLNTMNVPIYWTTTNSSVANVSVWVTAAGAMNVLLNTTNIQITFFLSAFTYFRT